jgi:zinc finger SWIM domain-containing protein 3
VNFLGDSVTVDVFIMSEEAAARNVSNMPGSR